VLLVCHEQVALGYRFKVSTNKTSCPAGALLSPFVFAPVPRKTIVGFI
jgi:hypothetical protein